MGSVLEADVSTFGEQSMTDCSGELPSETGHCTISLSLQKGAILQTAPLPQFPVLCLPPCFCLSVHAQSETTDTFGCRSHPGSNYGARQRLRIDRYPIEEL